MKILTVKEYDELIKEAYDKGHSDGLFECAFEDIEGANSTVLFDFYNPDIVVYSVERIPRQLSTDKIEYTLISYITKEKSRVSWTAYCSRQMHEELVIQFADYLNARNTKTNKTKK